MNLDDITKRLKNCSKTALFVVNEEIINDVSDLQQALLEVTSENVHLRKQLHDLREEYDQEVISHDLTEKELEDKLKAQEAEHRKNVEMYANGVTALEAAIMAYGTCQAGCSEAVCRCGLKELKSIILSGPFLEPVKSPAEDGK